MRLDTTWFSRKNNEDSSLDLCQNPSFVRKYVVASIIYCYIFHYLHQVYNFVPSEAMEFLKSKRPQISMNNLQKKVISEFHKQLKMKSD